MHSHLMKTIRSAGLLATLGLSLVAATTGTAMAGDAVYRVDLNKTQVLRLPAAAGAVVIGNPGIADVTVHSPSTLFVIGRGFGETNLVILDRDGQTMLDASIQVTAITPQHGVRLYNAKSRETYSCVPYCQPSPVLGDSADFIGSNSAPQAPASSVGAIFEGAAAQPGNVGTAQNAPEFFSPDDLDGSQF